ncbi:MAG: von Willebrand factor type A domain-containing protein, partial [Acidobacteria bacterium]|nr:von Willebrand factor type A domain-containing protein [Acidobacteriota bacterium]
MQRKPPSRPEPALKVPRSPEPSVREAPQQPSLVPPAPSPPPAHGIVLPESRAFASGGRLAKEEPAEQDEPAATMEDEVSVVAKAPVVDVASAVAGQAMSDRRQRKAQRPEAKRLAELEVPKPRASYTGPPSTGGTAEPNDQPYGDVFFRDAETNPFIDTEEDRLSTFGLDVDTGSYTVARRYLSDGNLPAPDSVRVEEWVNAFDYGDRPPARGDFALRAEGAPTPFAGERYRLLRFSIKGRTVDAEDRKPAVLTFVVDVSGSMDRENRLGLVKESLSLLLDELSRGDRVGLVIFGSRGEVLLEPSADLSRIRAAIERLVPGGSTNAEEGLTLGYELASRYFREGGINRVILCSDGVANVGRTGPESILERIRREANRGIELTTLGFGMGNYNDALMEQLADQGDGRYAYLDTLDEARRVLVEDLTGTLQTIASEARAQVEFNPEVVER